jgi:hypothetical protein
MERHLHLPVLHHWPVTAWIGHIYLQEWPLKAALLFASHHPSFV